MIRGVNDEFVQSVSILDSRKPKTDELVFTQREILNENHVYYFKGKNEFKRNVILYGVPSEYPLRKRTIKDVNDIVSFYTKYPRGMKQYFGEFKIYTHILDDSSDLSAIAYAMSIESQDITNIMKDDIGDIGENLQLLSEKLSRYEWRIGFAVYSNKYGKSHTHKDSTKEFILNIYISKDIIRGDRDQWDTDIQMICLYQDVNSDDKVFKNIVTYDPTDKYYKEIIPLSELLSHKKFEDEFTKVKKQLS